MLDVLMWWLEKISILKPCFQLFFWLSVSNPKHIRIHLVRCACCPVDVFWIAPWSPHTFISLNKTFRRKVKTVLVKINMYCYNVIYRIYSLKLPWNSFIFLDIYKTYIQSVLLYMEVNVGLQLLVTYYNIMAALCFSGYFKIQHVQHQFE